MWLWCVPLRLTHAYFPSFPLVNLSSVCIASSQCPEFVVCHHSVITLLLTLCLFISNRNGCVHIIIQNSSLRLLSSLLLQLNSYDIK